MYNNVVFTTTCRHNLRESYISVKYDLNAVEPREITQSKTASYDPKPRIGETERLDWIDVEQPRDTKLFRDYEGKPFKVHCEHCLKI